MDKYTVLWMGPPGTGKSYGAATVAKLGKTLLLACKGREARSIGYVQNKKNVDTEIYEDVKWTPSLKRFQADAYMNLLRRLDALYEDDTYDAVIIDPFTDFAGSIAHHILAPIGVGSPGDMADTFAFYVSLKDKADEAIRLATGLATHAKRPKHVIVTMHVQPPKEEQIIKGVAKPSADKVARGIEYEGSVLPMIDGAYRRKMAGDFDIVIYSGVDQRFNKKSKKQEPWYYIQISPDRDKHSKIAVGIPTTDQIDNDFSKLLEAISVGPTK